MENYKLLSIYFKKLKGLDDVKIVFEKPLTAIMGVNGAGKTTVIHALACAYQPTEYGKGEDHRFPDFFIPNTDALWNGSDFTIENEKYDEKGNKNIINRRYRKSIDRWMPPYSKRLKRNVYYIGIDTCLPEIEKKKGLTRISYSSMYKNDKHSNDVIKSAAGIMNIDYNALLENTFKKKHFNGVELSSGLKYSSLSMGTGEQRTIKILDTVINAEKNSLVLIDEIDLLLHISALKRLIKELYDIAKHKNLQIVFTTHSLEMSNLTEYLGIQYINNIYQGDKKLKTVIYDSINTDLIYSLNGDCERPIKIFVEDDLAKSIINEILRMYGIKSKANVFKFGSASNGFTIAASQVMQNFKLDNVLVILDGDVYITLDEKVKQIEKKLSGNEQDGELKREKALSIIQQFNLPNGVAPERFFYDLLKKYGFDEGELYSAAMEIHAVTDSHEWINKICQKLNESEENIISRIIRASKETKEWDAYISSIREWILKRKTI